MSCNVTHVLVFPREPPGADIPSGGAAGVESGRGLEQLHPQDGPDVARVPIPRALRRELLRLRVLLAVSSA